MRRCGRVAAGPVRAWMPGKNCPRQEAEVRFVTLGAVEGGLPARLGREWFSQRESECGCKVTLEVPSAWVCLPRSECGCKACSRFLPHRSSLRGANACGVSRFGCLLHLVAFKVLQGLTRDAQGARASEDHAKCSRFTASLSAIQERSGRTLDIDGLDRMENRVGGPHGLLSLSQTPPPLRCRASTYPRKNALSHFAC